MRSGMRDRINGAAARSPLGALECSMDLAIGEQTIPAGSYNIGFMLSEKFEWQMVLLKGEKQIPVLIPFIDSPAMNKRLVFSIYAGDVDGSVGVYFGFGNRSGTLTLLPSKAGESGS